MSNQRKNGTDLAIKLNFNFESRGLGIFAVRLVALISGIAAALVKITTLLKALPM